MSKIEKVAYWWSGRWAATLIMGQTTAELSGDHVKIVVKIERVEGVVTPIKGRLFMWLNIGIQHTKHGLLLCTKRGPHIH